MSGISNQFKLLQKQKMIASKLFYEGVWFKYLRLIKTAGKKKQNKTTGQSKLCIATKNLLNSEIMYSPLVFFFSGKFIVKGYISFNVIDLKGKAHHFLILP